MAEYAEGGRIEGPDESNDNIPVILERGYVIPTDKLVEAYGQELLDEINKSIKPKLGKICMIPDCGCAGEAHP